MNGIISYGCLNQKKLESHKNIGMEIVYVAKGTLNWQVDGKEECLCPSSVFFTLPWQTHGSTQDYEPGNYIYWLTFKLDRLYKNPVNKFGFHKNLNFSQKESVQISKIFCSAKKHGWIATDELFKILKLIIIELKNPGMLSEKYIGSLLRTLVIELSRIISKTNHVKNKSDDYKIKTLIAKLNTEYNKDWTLSKMSEICGLKRSQLTEKIKTFTGDTPMKYLNRIRVNKARNMLQDSEWNITEIAFKCGFNSSQYFNKLFKYFNEISPKEYINKMQKKSSSTKNKSEWRSEKEEKKRLEEINLLSW